MKKLLLGSMNILKIAIVSTLIGNTYVLASDASEQLSQAMTQLKNNCRSSYNRSEDSVTQAKKLQSAIKDLLDKVDDYSDTPYSVKSNLKDARSEISTFLDAIYTYKTEMSYCNSWHPKSSLYGLKEKYESYQHTFNQAKEASEDFQNKVEYYNDALSHYKKAISIIKDN